MDDWQTNGIPSSHATVQLQAVAGLLQDALSATAESRRRADHLHSRLFTLLTHVRSAQSKTGAPIADTLRAELHEEINGLGKATEEVLDAVEAAADALWDASSVVRPPFRTGAAGTVGTPPSSRTRDTASGSSSASSPESVNDITRRNDAKYRD